MFDDACAATTTTKTKKKSNSLITTVMIIGFYHMSSNFKMLIMTLCDYTDSTYSFLNHTQLYNLSDGRENKKMNALNEVIYCDYYEQHHLKASALNSVSSLVDVGDISCCIPPSVHTWVMKEARRVLGGVISNLALLPPQPILQSYSDCITHTINQNDPEPRWWATYSFHCSLCSSV